MIVYEWASSTVCGLLEPLEYLGRTVSCHLLGILPLLPGVGVGTKWEPTAPCILAADDGSGCLEQSVVPRALQLTVRWHDLIARLVFAPES